jgi:hypothetical protein
MGTPKGPYLILWSVPSQTRRLWVDSLAREYALDSGPRMSA